MEDGKRLGGFKVRNKVRKRSPYLSERLCIAKRSTDATWCYFFLSLEVLAPVVSFAAALRSETDRDNGSKRISPVPLARDDSTVRVVCLFLDVVVDFVLTRNPTSTDKERLTKSVDRS